jgi:hypothetical protein
MSRWNLTTIVSTVILGIAACSLPPAGAIQPVVSPTVVPATEVPTQVVWFPPTVPSPAAAIATPEPTPERKPGVGELMVADDMTTTVHWNAAVSGQASTTVSDRGLTLSAEPGQPPVISLHRSAVFDDMYIEITARPSLCKDRDAYGLVFRAPNEVAYYRFVAICNGTTAAERVSLGTPRVLQPATATSDVPVGAPGEVRLGVWARGSEFRFFLNDRYQFTVIDRNYVAGGIGVFAQAGGDTPVVVTFSGLRVNRLEPSVISSPATP